MGRENFTGVIPISLFIFLFCISCLMPHAPCLSADEVSEESHQLPRFVTIRAKEINLRTGPGERYPIDWVIKAKGWPLEITAEFDNWRRVRDYQGTSGWVHRVMLSKKRSMVNTQDNIILRRAPGADAQPRAHVAAGVHGELKKCEKSWCEVNFDGGKGWLPASALWGTDVGDMKEKKN